MIEVNSAQLEIAKNLLSSMPEKVPRIQAAAINRSITTARAEIVRSVRRNYIVKTGDVRSTIKITKATFSMPIGRIKSVGNPIPLIKFDTNKKNPITVRVKKSGSRKTIKGAFVQKMPSTGHVGIFIRAGKARYPIKQLYGPSIPQMIGNGSVIKTVEEKATEMLDKRMEHEINRLLEAGR